MLGIDGSWARGRGDGLQCQCMRLATSQHLCRMTVKFMCCPIIFMADLQPKTVEELNEVLKPPEQVLV